MRILILQRDALFPPAHGGAKSIAAIGEGLAPRGHAVWAALPVRRRGERESTFTQGVSDLEARGIAVDGDFVSRFSHRGIEGLAYPTDLSMAAIAADAVHRVHPDVVVLSDDGFGDDGEVIAAVREAGAPRVVLIAWTLFALPFGPWAASRSLRAAERCQHLDAILLPSRFAADYVQRWSGALAQPVRFPVFGDGPFPCLADRSGPVLFINPSNMKGIAIFLGLARAFPEVPFHAVAGWATDAGDLEAMRALPNVKLVARADRIADRIAGTSIVLFPSLVDETFPLVPIEAMLHGVPVLASNMGGVREALLGVDYVLPVRPLERFRLPLPHGSTAHVLSPAQDLDPWMAALETLRSSPAGYGALSRRAHAASHEYVARVNWDDVCEALAGRAAAYR